MLLPAHGVESPALPRQAEGAALRTYPDVRLSYGPLLIGVFVNLMLYGVFVGQALTYFQSFVLVPRSGSTAGSGGIAGGRHSGSRPAMHRDTWPIVFLVSYLCVIETINTFCDMGIVYQPLILDYGHDLDHWPALFWTEPLLVVLVSTPIQIFFAYRIWALTHSRWLPCIVIVCAATSLVGGLATTSRVLLLGTFASKPALHPPALVWLLGSAVSDVCVTTGLVWGPRGLSHRKTGFLATDGVIDRIIRTTIQTGMMTSMFSILDVICFMLLPHNAINFVFDFPLSKLYSNALLSTLNHRARLGAQAMSDSQDTQSVRDGVRGCGCDHDEGRREPGTSHALVFEDMALVSGGAGLATTGFGELKLDEEDAIDEEGDIDGEKEGLEELDIVETPRDRRDIHPGCRPP